MNSLCWPHKKIWPRGRKSGLAYIPIGEETSQSSARSGALPLPVYGKIPGIAVSKRYSACNPRRCVDNCVGDLCRIALFPNFLCFALWFYATDCSRMMGMFPNVLQMESSTMAVMWVINNGGVDYEMDHLFCSLFSEPWTKVRTQIGNVNIKSKHNFLNFEPQLSVSLLIITCRWVFICRSTYSKRV